MKKFIFIILLLFPIVLFSQTIDLRIPVISKVDNADSLGSKAPSFYIDTLNNQDIFGSKVFKDDLVLDSTLSIGVSSPDATSILDIVSTIKGILQPRMTEVQRDAISTPAEGLEIYDLTSNVPNFYNGTAWRRFSHTTAASLEEGGVVISESANGSGIFTDSANFFWDNTNKRLGIGTSSPDNTLDINGFIEYGNKAITLGVGVTTFVATSNGMTITGDGGANTIATITGVTNGGFLSLIFVNGLVTITDDNSHADNSIDLNASFTSADDVVLRLEHDGTSWYEVSRSVN